MAQAAGGRTFKGAQHSRELELHAAGCGEPLVVCCRELKWAELHPRQIPGSSKEHRLLGDHLREEP